MISGQILKMSDGKIIAVAQIEDEFLVGSFDTTTTKNGLIVCRRNVRRAENRDFRGNIKHNTTLLFFYLTDYYTHANCHISTGNSLQKVKRRERKNHKYQSEWVILENIVNYLSSE